jgi:hypothetical protein
MPLASHATSKEREPNRLDRAEEQLEPPCAALTASANSRSSLREASLTDRSCSCNCSSAPLPAAFAPSQFHSRRNETAKEQERAMTDSYYQPPSWFHARVLNPVFRARAPRVIWAPRRAERHARPARTRPAQRTPLRGCCADRGMAANLSAAELDRIARQYPVLQLDTPDDALAGDQQPTERPGRYAGAGRRRPLAFRPASSTPSWAFTLGQPSLDEGRLRPHRPPNRHRS